MRNPDFGIVCKGTRVWKGIILFVQFLGLTLAFAQFNFPDFSNPAGLRLNGSAAIVSNRLRLTPAVGSRMGSAWYTTPQNLTAGFTATFQFQITDQGNGGADGFSFNVQNDGLGVLVGEDGTMGDLAVSFDTWDNNGEPSGNFVEIFYNGVSLGQTNLSTVNLSDGAIHTAMVGYGEGYVVVAIDGTLVAFANGVNLASLSPAYVGFGARTGGAWENHDILNWQFVLEAPPPPPPPPFTKETVLSGLSLPTCLEFIAPNEFLVGEKNAGRVKHVVNGSVVGTVLDLPVSNSANRGLLGMTLDPDFEQNGYVYLFYTRSTNNVDGGPRLDSRVERYRWTGSALVEPVTLVTFPSDPTQDTGFSEHHEGGTILFGPDGKLYGIVGDLDRGSFSNPRIEQNTSVTAIAGAGGIFRLNPDGTTPADNPFFSHASPIIRRWFAYGIRNSFGLTFDSLTGKLWMTENGPNVYDEINLVRPGFNSGWRKIMGPDSRDARYGENGNQAYNANQLTYLPGAHYADPKFSWLTPIGVTAILFLRSARFEPDVRDQCVVGDVNTANLYLFPMNTTRDGFNLSGPLADLVADNSEERNMNVWGIDYNITTDLDLGPDGYLYALSFGTGQVYRLRPTVPPTVINGKVKLQDFVGARLDIPLTLQLKSGNTILETINTTLDAYGRYSVRVTNPGTYTVVAKALHWLSAVQANVVITEGGYAYLRWDLPINGDVNGDNRIDDKDLSRILLGFGTTSPVADLNGDGTVNNSDLNLVLVHFGQQGEI